MGDVLRLKAIFAVLVASTIVVKFQACSDVAFSPAETDLGSLSYLGTDVIEKVVIEPGTKSEAVPFNLILVLDESKSMKPYLDRFSEGLKDLFEGLRFRNVNVEVYFSQDPKNCERSNANTNSDELNKDICHLKEPVAQLKLSDTEANFDSKVFVFYQTLSGLLQTARDRASDRDINPYSACTVLRRLHKAYKEKSQGAFSFVVITDENDASQMRNCYAEYHNKRDIKSQTTYKRLRYTGMIMRYEYWSTGEGGTPRKRSSIRSLSRTTSDWSNGSSCSSSDRSALGSNIISCRYATQNFTTSVSTSYCLQGIENFRDQLMSQHKAMISGSSLSCYDQTSTSYDSLDHYYGFSSSVVYDVRGPVSLRSYKISDEFTELSRNYGIKKVFLAPIIITKQSQIKNSDQEVGSKYIELTQNLTNRSIASIADQDYSKVLQPLEVFAQKFYARSYQLSSKFYPTLVGTRLHQVKARFPDGSEKIVTDVSYVDGKLAFDNSDDLDGAAWLEVKVVHTNFNSSSPQ